MSASSPGRLQSPRVWLGAHVGHRSQAATFLRFVTVGATGSASYGLLFLTLAAVTDASHLAINLAATIVSTVLTSELHRRFTFHAAGRSAVGRGQTAGLGMAAVGLAVSSLVLAGWNLVNPGAGDLSTLIVVYCCSGVVGLANFATQRQVLTHAGCHLRRRSRPTVPDLITPAPRAATG